MPPKRTAALAFVLLSACSQPAASTPPLPASAGPAGGAVGHVPQSRARANSANAIASWVIAASTYCPSKAGTIAINLLAENASGAVIGGTFGSPIVLKDSDTSGATRLSRTTVASSSQENLTMSYAPKTSTGPFKITSTTQNISAYIWFYPNTACVTVSPDIPRVVNGSSGTTVTLAGQNGATAPYQLGSSTSGTPPGACGSYVTVTQASATTFHIASRISWTYGCSIYGTAANDATIDPFGILLGK